MMSKRLVLKSNLLQVRRLRQLRRQVELNLVAIMSPNKLIQGIEISKRFIEVLAD